MTVPQIGTSLLSVPQSSNNLASSNLATAGTAGTTAASPASAVAGTTGTTGSTSSSSSAVNGQQLMAMLTMILAVALPALLGNTGTAGNASGTSSQQKEELKSTSQLAPAIQQLKQQNPNASPQDIANGLNSRFSNTQFTAQADGTLQYPLSGKNFKVVPDGQSQPTQV